jgi:hypothetical protein
MKEKLGIVFSMKTIALRTGLTFTLALAMSIEIQQEIQNVCTFLQCATKKPSVAQN